jgi:c-di-GMP-binding flagellar brake protein YcgR
MVLNGQQFSEVVSYLRDKVAASMAGSEKRRTSRMDLKSRIIIVPVHKGPAAERISVLTRDISLEGVGLLAAVPIAKGQQFIAFLPRNETETLFVLCEVMHCAVVADGMFTLGCQFVKIVSRDAAAKIQTPDEATVARIRESVLK